MEHVCVIGGGPAGSAAALAARAEGAEVRVLERSRVARHKVCGEFLSPEVCEVLQALGAWEAFARLGPARIVRCMLHFGTREKRWELPAPAFGLSRFALDRLLLECAATAGAVVERGTACGADFRTDAALVDAAGRHARSTGKGRLFGFKAHFEGPQNDAVDLFFWRGGYAGVSSIENGWTNVCGIAREDELRAFGFDFDEYAASSPALADRLRPLTRRMRWVVVAPLSYSPVAATPRAPGVYAAGDALGFVDPFTGSGMLNALVTGRMAGIAAARGIPASAHLAACRKALGRPFAVSALLRLAVQSDWAQAMAALTPGQVLFRFTRLQVRNFAALEAPFRE